MSIYIYVLMDIHIAVPICLFVSSIGIFISLPIHVYVYFHICTHLPPFSHTLMFPSRKVDGQLQSRIRLHVPKDSFLIYNCVPRKLKRHSSQNQNADIRHLLDSLVSALAVYATAFRSKLSLPPNKHPYLYTHVHPWKLMYIFLPFHTTKVSIFIYTSLPLPMSSSFNYSIILRLPDIICIFQL